jgi:uncharacterized protein
MGLERYELVILRRPSEPTEYDDDTLDRIQAEHLAFHAALRESGSPSRTRRCGPAGSWWT